jgi:hypothetical protein
VEQFRALLAHQQRVLGPDAPDNADDPTQPGVLAGSGGAGRGPGGQFRALLADQQRVLEPDAPDTLTTRSNLERLLG